MDTFAASVTITLVDKVSAGLASVARGFAKTQAAADALNAKMNAISATWQKGLLYTAGGAALAAPLIIATKAAEGYQHQLVQLTQAGMSNAEIAKSIGAAWATSSKVITSSARENIKVIGDLRSVFGSTDEAIKYAPKFAKIQGALTSISEGKFAGHSNEAAFAMAKALDSFGAVKNSSMFDQMAENMFKTMAATNGRITATDWQQTFKFMRASKFNFDDKFLFKVLPELMIENKGGSSGNPGAQIAAAYRLVATGVLNKRSAQELQRLGMVPAGSILKTTTTGTTLKGGLLGADIFKRNPYEWAEKVFIPHLMKGYGIKAGDTAKLIDASNQLFRSNALAGNVIAEFIKKGFQYDRFGGILDKTPGIDKAYATATAKDPATNWKALGAAFENLKVAFGESVVPIIIPWINRLASSLQRAAGFMHEHPGFTKLLVGINAAGAGALLGAGAFNILKASLMAFKFLVPMAGVFTKMTPAGLAMAAALLVVQANWKKISDWFVQHRDLWVHIAAGLVATWQKLGLGLQNLAAQFGIFMEKINAFTGIGAWGDMFKWGGAELSNAWADATHVTAKQALADRKLLGAHGMGGLVPAMAGGGKPVQHVTLYQTNNIHVPAIATKDRNDLAAFLGRTVAHHAAASSGNSTGRALATGGATRP